MASDNKTVAEIVSEMRRDAIAADAWCETHGEMASAASVLNRHADHIEAAHKREVEELRECLKVALASEYGRCRSRWPCALCSKNCNVKRWRNALEGVSK